VLWLVLPALFALRHHVPDQYVFYLPCYLPLALWCGMGFDWVAQQWRPGRTFQSVALGVILLAPVSTYALAPHVVQTLHLAPVAMRDLAWRDGWRFFLWPPKNDAWGARTFAESALEGAAEGALILADWTLQAPLEYLQDVEGWRPDLEIVGTGDIDSPQAVYLDAQCRSRTCYLADTNQYYDLVGIGQAFDLVPAGALHRLEPLAVGRNEGGTP
jgi:hypothetical protein